MRTGDQNYVPIDCLQQRQPTCSHYLLPEIKDMWSESVSAVRRNVDAFEVRFEFPIPNYPCHLERSQWVWKKFWELSSAVVWEYGKSLVIFILVWVRVFTLLNYIFLLLYVSAQPVETLYMWIRFINSFFLPFTDVSYFLYTFWITNLKTLHSFSLKTVINNCTV